MKHAFWPQQKGYRDIELGLDRTKEILARLDNPHKKLPPTIHIAGTNGKGSTLSFLKNILQANNKKIHCYTSPHLVEINERIILAGEKISDKFLTECLNICKNICEKEPKLEPTYFEGLTIAAFLAFSKVKADYLILEVGMGGRLDSTNVIDNPLCSVITPISYDHVEFLGNKLSQIAFEKSGIIKKNCPIFVAKQEKEALNVIIEKAKSQNSEIKIFNQDFDNKISKKNFNLLIKNNNSVAKMKLSSPEFMAGKHQIDNATLATYIAYKLLKPESFLKKILFKFKASKAIKNTKWPARLEKIDSGLYFETIKNKSHKDFLIFLDGSHNKQGSETINNFLNNYSGYKKIILFSMLKDKDIKAYLSTIKNNIDLLIAFKIENEDKSYSTQEILEFCQELNIKSEASQNIKTAISSIKEFNHKTLFLICGSLYSAGNFIAQNKPNHEKTTNS